MQSDLWLWSQDWSRRSLRFKKSAKTVASMYSSRGEKDISGFQLEKLKHRFRHLLAASAHMHRSQPRCPGYPRWYEDHCERPGTPEWEDAICSLTPSKRISPLLLQMSWLGRPLHYHPTLKWGYICLEEQLPQHGFDGHITADEVGLPAEQMAGMKEEEDNRVDQGPDSDFDDEADDEKLSYFAASAAATTARSITNDFYFVRLPHKDGRGLNVGNPLSKDFLDKLEQVSG